MSPLIEKSSVYWQRDQDPMSRTIWRMGHHGLSVIEDGNRVIYVIVLTHKRDEKAVKITFDGYGADGPGVDRIRAGHFTGYLTTLVRPDNWDPAPEQYALLKGLRLGDAARGEFPDGRVIDIHVLGVDLNFLQDRWQELRGYREAIELSAWQSTLTEAAAAAHRAKAWKGVMTQDVKGTCAKKPMVFSTTESGMCS
ncbi:MAG: hypothetical protein M1816_008254 [Peltula sp. TS41687]|nr:MAG: hypothetical protein M1816_008254 [Peltula sp. TS41687]